MAPCFLYFTHPLMTVKPIEGGVMKKLKSITYCYEDGKLTEIRSNCHDVPWYMPKWVLFKLNELRFSNDIERHREAQHIRENILTSLELDNYIEYLYTSTIKCDIQCVSGRIILTTSYEDDKHIHTFTTMYY